MVSQAYKGDVSEVLMGHESGIYIQHGEPRTWITTWSALTPDYTTLTFSDTTFIGDSSIFESVKPILKVPLGMLIGQRLTFHRAGSSNNLFASFYNEGFDSKVYTIVDHTLSSGATVVKIVPALEHTTSSRISGTGDAMMIHSTGMPVITSGTVFAMDADAALTKEVSTIDQFIGLASHMKLPDTKVTMHRHHVIGLGRQAAIQQTGKVHHQGGQLEMPLNNPRWLYYSLGREVVDASALLTAYSKSGSLENKVASGQSYADINSLVFGGTHTLVIGEYILFQDLSIIPTVQYKAAGGTTEYWPVGSSGSTLSSESHHFEKSQSSEIRRVVAIEQTATGYRCFLDGPLHYEHNTNDGIYAFSFDAAAATGSPNVNADGTVTNAVNRLLFSAEDLPSFSIEHSIRNRDVGSFNGAAESPGNIPGTSTDSKQLTRIFRGCKIVEWELTATVDAEVKYRGIFDSLSCYTDTGRLETSAGDRYTAHRLFQNTASDSKGRKDAGIASGSEKPYMFYNSSIKAFDQDIGFVTSFELRDKTGVEVFHAIGGTPVPETVDASNRSTKQVPYGGTRNASIIREGREEFELEMDIAITDPLLWHELRTHRQVQGTVNQDNSVIEIVMTKQSTGATGSQQRIRLLIDDYVITDAPIPVPDDKGLIHSRVLIHPKNIKVISTDTLFHC